MGLDLFIPAKSGRGRATKDYLIEALLEEPGLTIRKLQNRVRKNFGHAVTYQAVRKAVMLFVKTGVVVKKGKAYSIDSGWIDSLSDFCERLKAARRSPLAYRLLESKGESYQVMQFSSLISRMDYLEKFENAVVPTLKSKIVAVRIPHSYYGAMNQDQLRSRSAFFQKHGLKIYRACEADGFLDRVYASMYNAFGIKTKPGAKEDGGWFVVYGDCIFQTILEKNVKETAEKMFSQVRRLDEKCFRQLEKFYHKKFKIKVILQKNKCIAERLRAQVLGCFK